jgi:predicted NAD/FAD-binding protein
MAKIAIIGTGIAGLGSAYLLNPDHAVTVYEKADRVGGHSRTVTVDYHGRPIAVDTGFIVFNRANYPNLTGLFAHLGVQSHASDMSFAASVRNGWLEWSGRNINAVFGQRRNMLRPKFALLMRDVLKFNAQAEQSVARHPTLTVEGLMAMLGMGEWFRRYYLLPMSGAIWSCPPYEMMHFPARTLVKFFANHNLLSVNGQHRWYTVTGGAQEYIRRLTVPFAAAIRTNCGASEVTRRDGKVQIRDTQGGIETYDRVVMAAHGDETLALLKDASAAETAALSCFRYQRNRAVLHRDESLMPRRRRCWASWVYTSDGDLLHPKIAVTYWMNLLQGIDEKYPLFVSLNPQREISQDKIFDQAEFDHPVFDSAAIAAQPKIAALQGNCNTWFAGAYLGNGFHEDGLASAVAAARSMGCAIPWAKSQPGEMPREETFEDAIPIPLPGAVPASQAIF